MPIDNNLRIDSLVLRVKHETIVAQPSVPYSFLRKSAIPNEIFLVLRNVHPSDESTTKRMLDSAREKYSTGSEVLADLALHESDVAGLRPSYYT